VLQLHEPKLSTCPLGAAAMATARRSIIAALALGLTALWAAKAPPATQPVSTGSSPAMINALSLCRRQLGIDRTCATALTQALVVEQRKRDATATADRACHADKGKAQELVHGEVLHWNKQTDMLWIERDGLRLVIHLPPAKGYVRFAVIAIMVVQIAIGTG
jgi:hypothetical protein